MNVVRLAALIEAELGNPDPSLVSDAAAMRRAASIVGGRFAGLDWALGVASRAAAAIERMMARPTPLTGWLSRALDALADGLQDEAGFEAFELIEAVRYLAAVLAYPREVNIYIGE